MSNYYINEYGELFFSVVYVNVESQERTTVFVKTYYHKVFVLENEYRK